MELDDELKLIELAQSNVQAFSKLYDIYFPKIYRYCLNRVGQKEIAEDITSQVFLKSIEIIKRFDTKRRLRLGPWLYAITHNLIIDSVRRRSFFKELDQDINLNLIEESSAIERDLDISVMQKQIINVLNIINPRYAQIISLKFYSELNTDEIAVLMDIKNSQVPVIFFRALKAFKEEFIKKYPKSEIIYSLNS
jgi:RNA polymerase sigma-70 factor (ECF subfamily)